MVDRTPAGWGVGEDKEGGAEVKGGDRREEVLPSVCLVCGRKKKGGGA